MTIVLNDLKQLLEQVNNSAHIRFLQKLITDNEGKEPLFLTDWELGVLAKIDDVIIRRNTMIIHYINKMEELPDNSMEWWRKELEDSSFVMDTIVSAAKDFSEKTKRPIPGECWVINGGVWFKF